MKTPTAIWKEAEDALVAGDLPTLERLLREHEPLFREEPPESSWSGGLAPAYSEADARSILAREHHFGSFDNLTAHLEALQATDSPVARFEAAVEAIVAGDTAALERLLRHNPELIRARSTRQHRAALLHYVGANGVESWRQRTPPNAVQVAEILIKAGAEVDAMADMYGGSTTLGLVATSIHPLRVGVQNDLIDVLLNQGAAIDHPSAAGNRQSIVNGCLANGRPGAAEFLAGRGASLDLEGAAGVGRLDAVRSFFEESGRLKADATPFQMKSGFQWACEYGRTSVVELLLQRGIEPGEMHRGQTGLHWAAYGGHPEIIQLLLDRNTPVNLKDETWQTTPLGWALHGWTDPPEIGSRDYYEVVARLVAAGATMDPRWAANEKIRADARMLEALRGWMKKHARSETDSR
jgi:hypothetical protein